MSETTEADRAKAAELADQIDSMGPAMTYRTLAAALAAERAKARAPFLALAEEARAKATQLYAVPQLSLAANAYSGMADRIRRAAEEPEHVHRWAEVTRLGDAEIHLLCTLPECGARRTEPRT